MHMSSTFPGVIQLNHIERLELMEQYNSYSLKQWYTIIDTFPHLRSLSLSFFTKCCPPKIWIDVLINKLQQTKTNRLALLPVNIDSIWIDHEKIQFIMSFKDIILRDCRSAIIVTSDKHKSDAWL